MLYLLPNIVLLSFLFTILFILRKKPFAYYFFVLNHFFSATAVLNYYFVLTNAYDLHPHWSKIQSPFGYLFGPLLYLFVLFTLHPEKKLQWKHALHLIPFVLHTIEIIPYYALPYYEKWALVKNINVYQIWEQKQGMILYYYQHVFLKVVSITVYLILQVYTILRFLKTSSYVLQQQNKILLRWLRSETIIRFVLCCILIAVIIIAKYRSPDFLYIVPASLIAINILLSIALLFVFPEILGGLQLVQIQFAQPENEHVSISEEQEEMYRAENLDFVFEKTAEYKERYINTFKIIEIYFQTNQPFLDVNLTRQSLADKLGIPPKKITEAIYSCTHLHFTDYVNTYRLDFLSQQLKIGKLPWKEFTLEAIASEAGFGNRTTFHNAVKRIKNMTPSAFIEASILS